MIEVVFKNISVFPELTQQAILTTWGLLLFIVPIAGIVKILQSRCAKTAYHDIPLACKKIGDFLQRQIDDPIKYPKIEKALQYAMIAQSYALSFLLFVSFILLTLSWSITERELTVAQHIGVIFYCLACAYMSAALKTQGNRELLKLRATKST